MLGDILFQVGQAIGTVEGQLRGRSGDSPGRSTGSHRGGISDFLDDDGDPVAPDLTGRHIPGDRDVAVDAALSAGLAWLAARLLRPKPVRWPRVVMAGVAGALMAQAIGRLQNDAPDPDELPYAADPAELLGRLSAGVAVAAGYAAIVYPRLPGSPLLRGLAFGALEIAAAPRGGLVQLASQTPGIRFPLQALALPVDEDASPVAHLAFGLALGLLYRDGGSDEDVEEEDGDEEEDFED